jgi:Zn-finger protein
MIKMIKYPKHYKANPNEWIPQKQKMEWQCCDCGLVHNVWFKVKEFKDKKIRLFVKMTRNKKQTSKARKLKLNQKE